MTRGFWCWLERLALRHLVIGTREAIHRHQAAKQYITDEQIEAWDERYNRLTFFLKRDSERLFEIGGGPL